MGLQQISEALQRHHRAVGSLEQAMRRLERELVNSGAVNPEEQAAAIAAQVIAKASRKD